ncbi:MAG TPA: hypothetical protein VL003_00085 [Pusillimonas sp.]|uniref:hypothetical protein n=1 Tax=Pusillimonas sp. TaxID=3040095 RepID=UPI002D129978|nr:hypothetical protein [Pusillimonas sp.]HUH86434.1 hypothetical protein [Pusillimonas sp.]
MHDRVNDLPGPERPRRYKLVRLAGFVLLAVVLALAFMGHLSADMRVQWANLMSLCGF